MRVPVTTPLAPLSERQGALHSRLPAWRPMPLHAALDAAAQEWPERPYIVTDAATLSYADVAARSKALAQGLIAAGVQPGSRVALEMANDPEFVISKYAVSRTGAICIPVNFLNRRDELAYVLEQAAVGTLIVMDRFRDLDYVGMLDEISPDWERNGGGRRLPELQRVVIFNRDGQRPRPDAVTLQDVETRGSALGESADWPAVDPGAPADILYTSGTTGGPKGVLLTHDMLLRTAYAAAFARGFEDGRRIHFALPMYHVFGYIEGMLPVIFVGGSIVPHRVFDPVASLRAIEKHRATDILAIPLMTEAMLDAQQRLTADGHPADLSSLSAILSSGTMAPPSHFDRIDAELGWTEVTTGYGMSETTASSTVTRPDDPIERRRSTNGRLRDAGVAGDPELDHRLVVYRAVDPETGQVLDYDEVGELQARGPGVTAGYWQKPAETAAAFTQDGWFRTGDLGRLDEDGYLTLVGRVKDCYRCGGEQVVPKDVEDVLLTHPAVEQALVVPVPDARMGEAGAAFVVRRANTTVTADELINLAAQKLAKFKVPRHILWIDADQIPLTASGRPRKFLLAERAAQSVLTLGS